MTYIELPDRTIPVKTAQVNTDVKRVVRVLNDITGEQVTPHCCNLHGLYISDTCVFCSKSWEGKNG